MIFLKLKQIMNYQFLNKKKKVKNINNSISNDLLIEFDGLFNKKYLNSLDLNKNILIRDKLIMENNNSFWEKKKIKK